MSLREIRRRLPVLVPLTIGVVLIAGGGLAAIETDTMDNYGEGLWWAVSLMSTVGFAGENPSTPGGQLLSGFLMVFGFATLSLVTASFASMLVIEGEEEDFEQQRVTEAEVLAELKQVRDRLDTLEARIARRQ